MDNLIAKLKEEFYLYGATTDDYKAILMDFSDALTDDEKLNHARAWIRAEIKENWQNKNRDWLVNFIEESFCLGNTKTYNVRYIIYLLEHLKSLSIFLDEESLKFLTEKSPKFRSLLESLIQHRRKEFEKIVFFHSHELLNDALKKYVKIRKKKPCFTEISTKLTIQEESEIQRLALDCLNAKDTDGYIKYRNILIESLQETIETTAKNYLGYGFSFEDLVNLGNVYLLENFENHLQLHTTILRARIKCALINYFSVLVKNAQMEETDVEQMSVGEDPMFDSLYQNEVKEVIRQVIRDLKPKAERVIRLRYGLSDEVISYSPHSTRELARMENLTHQAIESRIKKALKGMSNHPTFIEFFEEKEAANDFLGLETILDCTKKELFILLAGISNYDKRILKIVFGTDLTGSEDLTSLSERAISKYTLLMKKLEEDLQALRSYQNSDLPTIIGEKSYQASKIKLFLKMHPEIENIILSAHQGNIEKRANYNTLTLEEKKQYHQGIIKIKAYLAKIKASPYLWNIIEYEKGIYDFYYMVNNTSPKSRYLAMIFGSHYTAREEITLIGNEEKYFETLLELKRYMEQASYQRVNIIEFTSDGILLKCDDMILPFQVDIIKELFSTLVCPQISIMMFSAYVGINEKRKTIADLEKMFQLTCVEEIKKELKVTFEMLLEVATIRNISLGGDLIEALGYQRVREKPKD